MNTLPLSPTNRAPSAARLLILLALFGATFYLLQGVSGTVRTPIQKPLSNFPLQLDEWKTISSHKSSDAVIKMLGVDDYIEYNYANPEGRTLNFYAAFYESVGTGGGYHSPKNCIPGGGWGIDSTKTIEVHPTNGKPPVMVSEMLIRNGNEYQVVVYWYQNRGRIIASEYWEKIYLVLDAILMKRRDGTFVRLMAPVQDGSIAQTEQHLQRFAGLAMAELEHFLPGR
ncbi:exosortase C-terminal domain/associated protein EpsI [Desulfobulbus propionicus]|jgi:EpsI family protein